MNIFVFFLTFFTACQAAASGSEPAKCGTPLNPYIKGLMTKKVNMNEALLIVSFLKMTKLTRKELFAKSNCTDVQKRNAITAMANFVSFINCLVRIKADANEVDQCFKSTKLFLTVYKIPIPPEEYAKLITLHGHKLEIGVSHFYQKAILNSPQIFQALANRLPTSQRCTRLVEHFKSVVGDKIVDLKALKEGFDKICERWRETTVNLLANEQLKDLQSNVELEAFKEQHLNSTGKLIENVKIMFQDRLYSWLILRAEHLASQIPNPKDFYAAILKEMKSQTAKLPYMQMEYLTQVIIDKLNLEKSPWRLDELRDQLAAISDQVDIPTLLDDVYARKIRAHRFLLGRISSFITISDEISKASEKLAKLNETFQLDIKGEKSNEAMNQRYREIFQELQNTTVSTIGSRIGLPVNSLRTEDSILSNLSFESSIDNIEEITELIEDHYDSSVFKQDLEIFYQDMATILQAGYDLKLISFSDESDKTSFLEAMGDFMQATYRMLPKEQGNFCPPHGNTSECGIAFLQKIFNELSNEGDDSSYNGMKFPQLFALMEKLANSSEPPATLMQVILKMASKLLQDGLNSRYFGSFRGTVKKYCEEFLLPSQQKYPEIAAIKEGNDKLIFERLKSLLSYRDDRCIDSIEYLKEPNLSFLKQLGAWLFGSELDDYFATILGALDYENITNFATKDIKITSYCPVICKTCKLFEVCFQEVLDLVEQLIGQHKGVKTQDAIRNIYRLAIVSFQEEIIKVLRTVLSPAKYYELEPVVDILNTRFKRMPEATLMYDTMASTIMKFEGRSMWHFKSDNQFYYQYRALTNISEASGDKNIQGKIDDFWNRLLPVEQRLRVKEMVKRWNGERDQRIQKAREAAETKKAEEEERRQKKEKKKQVEAQKEEEDLRKKEEQSQERARAREAKRKERAIKRKEKERLRKEEEEKERIRNEEEAKKKQEAEAKRQAEKEKQKQADQAKQKEEERRKKEEEEKKTPSGEKEGGEIDKPHQLDESQGKSDIKPLEAKPSKGNESKPANNTGNNGNSSSSSSSSFSSSSSGSSGGNSGSSGSSGGGGKFDTSSPTASSSSPASEGNNDATALKRGIWHLVLVLTLVLH